MKNEGLKMNAGQRPCFHSAQGNALGIGFAMELNIRANGPTVHRRTIDPLGRGIPDL
jgi:hypothetical protein